MATIKLEFEGVEAYGAKRAILDKGDYTAVVAGFSPEKNEEGKTSIKVVFGNVNGEKGRILTRRYFLSPKALGFLKGDLIRLGVEVPEGNFNVDTDDVVGRECVISVDVTHHHKDPNRMVNEVVSIVGSESGGSTGGDFSWD